MRLLVIANPEAYRGTLTDVPLSYARLAAHPQVELYHANTEAMLAPGPDINATPVEADFSPEQFCDLQYRETSTLPPEHFDAAFCRTLKPFADNYLDRMVEWSHKLLLVNHPAGLQQQLRHEFFLSAAHELAPPSLITADDREAQAFMQEHGIIVAKRGNSCGGRGVFRIEPTDDGGFSVDNILEGAHRFDQFSQSFDYISRNGKEQLLFMRFLPRVVEGDKRIVVVDGEIYGIFVRTSTQQHWVQNVTFGANCDLQPATEADRELVAATSEPYRAAGIHILGYDLLRGDDGKWLISEINAGNIGGLFRLQDLGMKHSTERFVRWLHAFGKRGRGRRRTAPEQDPV